MNCNICGKPVPEKMLNRFFCSHECREIRLVETIKAKGKEVKYDPYWGIYEGNKDDHEA
jgi:endogenous inhibitor of DNA gyrase (YacG/DUF329 family)